MAAPLLALAAIPAAAQAIMGTWQYLNAIKQAKKNVRPTYEIDPTFQYNIDLLTNSMGLPQGALEMLYNRNGQATSQGIDAILANGGNANQIAGLIGNQYAANQNIGLQDALQRKQDLSGIINAQLMLAGERDKEFQLNKYAPYADKAQALASQKEAGLKNIGGAVNSVSGAFAANATNNLAESLFGGKMGNTSNATTPNSGVNTNYLYQQLFGNQNQQQPFSLPNTQLNLPQNYFNNYNYPLPMNFGNQQQSQFGMFNPSQLSLYNNPYNFSL